MRGSAQKIVWRIMTEPKRFKRGKHTYTRWGPNFKEVRVDGAKKDQCPSNQKPPPISVDIDANTAMGVYSNLTMVHRSATEVILDFVFLQPGQHRGRLRSRVILSPRQVKRVAELLSKTAEELK